MSLALSLLAVTTFAAAWWLTGRVRQYALARQVIDVPNARSSHTVATPRGGGMAIVIATIAGLCTAAAAGAVTWRLVAALAVGGAAVAVVGFLDDHRPMARRWRLLAHFAAALWVVTTLGGLPPLPVFGNTVELGWPGDALAVLYAAWLLNLTNFMDGIDGIAAVEVITVSLSGTLLYATVVAAPGHTAAPLILAAASAGFLVWNWPPARIFMGDAGSGFVGLAMAALSLDAAATAPHLFWSWLILMAVFIVDATVTLLRRLLHGEPVHEPHRTHAYQHAASKYGRHLPVTAAVGAINLAWLAPLALLVARGAIDGVLGVLIAAGPLAAAALWLGAGRPERPGGSR